MFKILFVVLSCVFVVESQYACVRPSNDNLKNNVPPSGNFNLSHWYLTLPDENATNIEPYNLTNGYSSQYFYTDSNDGSMSYYCPTEGGTTPNAHFPRSELRELCNGESTHYNWLINGKSGLYEMWETVRIDESSTGNLLLIPNNTLLIIYKIANGTIVGQIHAYNWHPLIMVFWWDYNNGTLQAKYQLDSTGNNETWFTLMSNVGYNKFDVYIGVNSLEYSVSIGINNKILLTIDASFWTNYSNYFKAGNYIQDYRKQRFLIVHEYCLNVSLSGEFDCVYNE